MFQRKLNKSAIIKQFEIGDRVYVRQVPRKGLPTKLQLAYTDLFRVLIKVSDVVVYLKNIRSDNIKALHSDRVRVMDEDNITPHTNPNLKGAYRVHDNDETMRDQNKPSTSRPIFRFLS